MNDGAGSLEDKMAEFSANMEGESTTASPLVDPMNKSHIQPKDLIKPSPINRTASQGVIKLVHANFVTANNMQKVFKPLNQFLRLVWVRNGVY